MLGGGKDYLDAEYITLFDLFDINCLLFVRVEMGIQSNNIGMWPPMF